MFLFNYLKILKLDALGNFKRMLLVPFLIAENLFSFRTLLVVPTVLSKRIATILIRWTKNIIIFR